MKKFHHTFRGAIFHALPLKRLLLLGLFVAFYAALSNLEIVPSKADLEAIPPTVEQVPVDEDSSMCDDVAQQTFRISHIA